MAIETFTYKSGVAPAGYACGECSKRGCKLWRQYNTMMSALVLLCVDCAGKNQSRDVSDVDSDGRAPIKLPGEMTTQHRSDSIGWLVPAVPTEDGETCWGYTSVPDDGVVWWRALPTRTP